MSEKLLPCAFCGAEARFYENAVDFVTKWSVSCTGCDVNLDACADDKAGAASAWNTRRDLAPHTREPGETPLPEFYPLALKPAQNSQVDDHEHWVIDADGGHVFCICGSRERAEGIVTVLNAAASPATQEIPADVRRLVVAARVVAFEDQGTDAIKALDQASEAFADRVRWDDEPVAPPARSAATSDMPIADDTQSDLGIADMPSVKDKATTDSPLSELLLDDEVVTMLDNEPLCISFGHVSDFTCTLGDIRRAVWRIPAAPTASPNPVVADYATTETRDWKEDASHENGDYTCQCCECGHSFTGHKRRVICKACSNRLKAAPATSPEMPDNSPEPATQPLSQDLQDTGKLANASPEPDAVREALVGMVEAWDALPPGFYTSTQLSDWMNSNETKAAVEAARDALSRKDGQSGGAH